MVKKLKKEKNSHSEAVLEEVLQEFFSSHKIPEPHHVQKFTSLYPQFTDEIIDFAVAWMEVKSSPRDQQISSSDIDIVVNRTVGKIKDILNEEGEAQPQPAISDLSVEIKHAGYSIQGFENKLGIDRSILTCLAQRSIKPETIPNKLIMHIAKLLNRSASSLESFFREPPYAQNIFRAEKKAKIERADFRDVVCSADISMDEKRRLLN